MILQENQANLVQNHAFLWKLKKFSSNFHFLHVNKANFLQKSSNANKTNFLQNQDVYMKITLIFYQKEFFITIKHFSSKSCFFHENQANFFQNHAL